MKNKINVAKLLKDCPNGMELNCLTFDNIFFQELDWSMAYPIICYRKNNDGTKENIYLTEFGSHFKDNSAKCIIFPKGKTTWEGFIPPCKFKDGDIVITTLGNIAIIRKYAGEELFYIYGIMVNNNFYKDEVSKVCVKRLATEEEKQKLFQAIKNNGYKWNSNTKTLEKLIEPKFKAGDWIVFNGLTLYVKEVVKGFYRTISKGDGIANSYDWDIDNAARLWTIQDAKDGDVLANDKHILIFKELGYTALSNGKPENLYAYCGIKPDGSFELGKEHYCFCGILHIHPATKEQRDTLFAKMKETNYKWNPETKTLEKFVEPKFKVGDRIKHKFGDIRTIIAYGKIGYWTSINDWIDYENQEDWELVPNKFDISTLIPFESRVLIRDNKLQKWYPAIWGVYDPLTCFPYKLIGCISNCCIPYEGNEHLCNTTNDCDEFYKTWQ